VEGNEGDIMRTNKPIVDGQTFGSHKLAYPLCIGIYCLQKKRMVEDIIITEEKKP
jgi:hypothetical protein